MSQLKALQDEAGQIWLPRLAVHGGPDRSALPWFDCHSLEMTEKVGLPRFRKNR